MRRKLEKKLKRPNEKVRWKIFYFKISDVYSAFVLKQSYVVVHKKEKENRLLQLHLDLAKNTKK